MKIILYLIVIFIVSFSGIFWAIWNDKWPSLPDKPTFPKKWFGEGQRPANEPKAITPFQINVTDKVKLICKRIFIIIYKNNNLFKNQQNRKFLN